MGPRSHPAQLEEEVLQRDVGLERTRGSGPGGQHRNRVATEVRLTHRPTGIRGAAGERRSAKDNMRVAMFRLRINLALRWRPPLSEADCCPAEEYRPSALWRERTRARKIACNSEHRDFPAVLAEALNVLQAQDDNPAEAARALGISSSQFVKFLAKEPAALAALNERRKSRGVKPLRSR